MHHIHIAYFRINVGLGNGSCFKIKQADIPNKATKLFFTNLISVSSVIPECDLWNKHYFHVWLLPVGFTEEKIEFSTSNIEYVFMKALCNSVFDAIYSLQENPAAGLNQSDPGL